MFLACLSIFRGFVLSMLRRRAYWDELFLRFGGLGFRVQGCVAFFLWDLAAFGVLLEARGCGI